MTAARTLVTALLAGAIAGLSGCASLDSMRGEFVGLRYLQSAGQQLRRLPVDRARAVRHLDRALALLPDSPTVTALAGPLYVEARAYEKALPLLAPTQEEHDRERTILFAQCLLETGQRERGIRVCRKQIAEAVALRRRKAIGGAQFALLMNAAGYILADANAELAPAQAAIKEAVKLRPLEPAFVDSMGWVRFRQGHIRDAAFYLERAVRLCPREHPEILYHLGVAYARLGRIGDAERALRRAQWLDPDYDEVKAELRRLGRELPQPQLALACPPLSGVQALRWVDDGTLADIPSDGQRVRSGLP